MAKQENLQKGFIALTSTVILSVVLLMLMFSASTGNFFARFDSLGGEYKKVSLALSEACVNSALLRIAEDYDYSPPAGGEVVTVGSNSCIIKSVTCLDSPCEDTSGKKRLEIETYATYPEVNGSWSTNKIRVSTQNPTISDPDSLSVPIKVEAWE
jgi:hypothetical protein